MNLMGGVVTWLAAMFAVAGRESLSASLIGLSVTYAMQVRRTPFSPHYENKPIQIY